ncbi:MAG TPA: hypothetical protein VNU68_00315 [Verrucomicrobiae bacterium]|nr:hypothetical protein [Verrucomicrobiae bacterium]
MSKGAPETPAVAVAEAVAAPELPAPSQVEEPAVPPPETLPPAPAPAAEVVKVVAPLGRPLAAPGAAARPVASAETRQMVEALMQLTPGGAPLSAEQAAAWKHSLQALVQQGAAGVPAIRDFLALSKDLSLGSVNAQMLGYDTVRGALFDALRQIGGPEGTQASLEALNGTGDPREVLALARNLESMAPGEHRGEMLDSARQVLGMASRGELAGYDVGPLFEVFQKYGGAEALADLEQAWGQWRYYGAIGLANLPEGAGIPSLIKMATGPGGDRGQALEMLAQVSLQYPEARAVLLDQIRGGKVAPNQWPYLGSVLGGDHYQLPDALWYAAQNGAPIDRQKTAHIEWGNQNFYQGPIPGGSSPDQVSQQLALVEEIAAIASDPAAAQALQNARAVLNRRLTSLIAALGPVNQ